MQWNSVGPTTLYQQFHQEAKITRRGPEFIQNLDETNKPCYPARKDIIDSMKLTKQPIQVILLKY